MAPATAADDRLRNSLGPMARLDRTVFLVGGGLCTTTAFALLTWPQAAWATVLGWGMIAISVSDVRDFIVPDWLSLSTIPIGLVAVSHNDATALPFHVVGTMVGAAAFLAVRRGYFLLRGRQGLGLGDVKLAGVAGAWTGVEGFVIVVLTDIVALGPSRRRDNPGRWPHTWVHPTTDHGTDAPAVRRISGASHLADLFVAEPVAILNEQPGHADGLMRNISSFDTAQPQAFLVIVAVLRIRCPYWHL